MDKKISRVNWLNLEIKKLEHFLFTVVEFDENEKGIPSVNVFMRKKVDVKLSIFGTRFFGCGTHMQEIEIPNQIRNELIELTKIRLQKMKDELSSLI